jgi:hypothetical protein
MIKDLIRDIIYDKIDLSQALSRAKIIAYRIGNEEFKNWINRELNGYIQPSDILPEYRIIPCEIYAVLESYGRRRVVPFDLTQLEKDTDVEIYKMHLRQSISTLETGLKNKKGNYGDENLPINIVQFLKKSVENDFIIEVKRRIQFSQIENVLNLTKQTLVDTLLELSSASPDLEDDFQNTLENREKSSTIINNHISGNNINTNIGVGDNLEQNIAGIHNEKVNQILSELKDLNVPKDDLDVLKGIIEEELDKSKLGKKIMGWVGKMTNKAIEKGIELQVPLVIEKVQELL